MRANKINLMDDEWQKLVDVIDSDCDGVLTCDEWVKVLDPKINAQR